MPGRSLQWFTTISRDRTVGAGAVSNTHLLADMNVDLAKDSTVTRLIMEIHCETPALTNTHALAWGIVFVNADAVIASAFPDPGVAADTPPWLARGLVSWSSGDLSDSSQDGHIKIDNRSQRICRTRADQLHLIVENIDGGATIAYHVFARTLVRLP